MVKKRACIFISGSGTNLRSIIKNSRDYNFPINVSLVISNNKNAKGIVFAKKFSIPYVIISDSDKDKFEKVRVNANFEDVVKNIIKFQNTNPYQVLENIRLGNGFVNQKMYAIFLLVLRLREEQHFYITLRNF